MSNFDETLLQLEEAISEFNTQVEKLDPSVGIEVRHHSHWRNCVDIVLSLPSDEIFCPLRCAGGRYGPHLTRQLTKDELHAIDSLNWPAKCRPAVDHLVKNGNPPTMIESEGIWGQRRQTGPLANVDTIWLFPKVLSEADLPFTLARTPESKDANGPYRFFKRLKIRGVDCSASY